MGGTKAVTAPKTGAKMVNLYGMYVRYRVLILCVGDCFKITVDSFGEQV
jgi:hypothetical protein